MTRMLLPVLLALLGCTDTAAPAASYKATPPETGRWLGCSAFETPRGVVAVDRWAPVWFDPGSAQIKARDMATLDYFVSSYDGPADCLIVVSGHSDLAESAPRDLSLSRRRAEAVAKYLRRKGLAATIRIDPLGGTHPL